ncbi:MAG: hypothetical protein LKE27_07485 [Atopobiaceae bacterium]|jgi:hypothetical protein|nr:hypothetical protein [Atopobiaceae bacterium]
MAIGIIGQLVFSDIANAIREQNGTSTRYRPLDTAAAILALDDTKAGAAATIDQSSKKSVITDSVLTSIADAIRAQNGTDTRYLPGEMAQAIRDLVWDVGFKPRAVLYGGGSSLELNYLDGPQVSTGETPEQAWTISLDGCASKEEVPWNGVRSQIAQVSIGSSFAQLTCPDISYWFREMTALETVFYMENISGLQTADQAFYGCSELRSIFCSSPHTSTATSASLAFYGCAKLVGGHLAVAEDIYGAEAFTAEVGGFFASLADDERIMAHSYLGTDGRLLVGLAASATADATVAKGTFFANAHYLFSDSLSWYSSSAAISSVEFASDLDGCTRLSMGHWFQKTASASIAFSGWEYLHPVSAAYMFYGASSLEALDLRGLDPSAIANWWSTFGSMSALRTILVSEGWTLSGTIANGIGTFSSDTNLVGGNGTACSSSKTTVAMAVIDKEGQPGYLTAG